MTKPNMIAIAHEGQQPKIVVRGMLYSTALRGRVVENMHVVLRGESGYHVFDVWAHATDKLERGSGVFVAHTGVVHYHHFLPQPDTDSFIVPGKYELGVGAKLVGDKEPIDLFGTWLTITDEHANAIETTDSMLLFNWSPGANQYIPYMMKGKVQQFIESLYAPPDARQPLVNSQA